MNTLFRTRTAVVAALAAVALVAAGLVSPRAASAQAGGPNWGAVAGSQNDRAPARSTVSAYTVLQGTSDEFLSPSIDSEDFDLDRWTADFILAAEIKLPVIPVSIFGDISYRYVASGNEIDTGWGDATLGAKANIVRSTNVIFGAWLSGTLPIGSDDVRITDYKAGNLGFGASVAPVPWIFLNTNAIFGAIWQMEDPFSQASVESLEFRFMVEVGVLFPGDLGSGRIGIEGFYRENGFDKASFVAYAEGHLSIFFLRVAFPFDVDQGLAGVENGFHNAELTIFAGVSIGLPEF